MWELLLGHVNLPRDCLMPLQLRSIKENTVTTLIGKNGFPWTVPILSFSVLYSTIRYAHGSKLVVLFTQDGNGPARSGPDLVPAGPSILFRDIEPAQWSNTELPHVPLGNMVRPILIVDCTKTKSIYTTTLFQLASFSCRNF